MTDNPTQIAHYATKGNARRIRVFRESDGTYSYGEFHRMRMIARGFNYKNEADVMRVVHDTIEIARRFDGINFVPVRSV